MSNMYYVYTLYSLKNNKLYTGYTHDLKKRFSQHNNSSGGDYSKRNRPFSLVFYEAFISKKDAVKQELFYKTGYGRDVLKDKINNSISELNQ